MEYTVQQQQQCSTQPAPPPPPLPTATQPHSISSSMSNTASSYGDYGLEIYSYIATLQFCAISRIPVFSGNLALPFPGKREWKISGNPGRPGMETLVIRFWIPTHTQNLVSIPQEVSFPCMREIAHQTRILSFFILSSSNAPQPRPEPISTQNTSKDTVRARMCFSGFKNTNLTFKPVILEQPLFWAGFWRDVSEKSRPKTALQLGMLHVNSHKS